MELSEKHKCSSDPWYVYPLISMAISMGPNREEKVAASCRKHVGGSSIGDVHIGVQRQWIPVLVRKYIWLGEGEAHSLSDPLLPITYAGLKLSSLCALRADLLPCPTQNSFNSAAGVAGRVLQLPQDFPSL